VPDQCVVSLPGCVSISGWAESAFTSGTEWAVSFALAGESGVLQQVRQLVGQMEALGEGMDTPTAANREILFMQLLVLLRKSSLMEAATDNDARLNLLMAWLEDNFADEVCWEALAEKFSLSLRTLHRQLKQQTGLTPQRYLNRLRLIKARHLLRHSDDSVTDIAYLCGFGDSNHFSTLFRREFKWSPRDIRQGAISLWQAASSNAKAINVFIAESQIIMFLNAGWRLRLIRPTDYVTRSRHPAGNIVMANHLVLLKSDFLRMNSRLSP
jgi:AraC-like DNA-binding protein